MNKSQKAKEQYNKKNDFMEWMNSRPNELAVDPSQIQNFSFLCNKAARKVADHPVHQTDRFAYGRAVNLMEQGVYHPQDLIKHPNWAV